MNCRLFRQELTCGPVSLGTLAKNSNRRHIFMFQARKIPFLIPVSIGLLLMLPVVIITMLTLGFTEGSEFSPDDFTSRSFFYNRIPFFNWTIFGKKYDDTTTDFEKSLLADGLIPQSGSSTKTWHLYRDLGSESDGRPSSDCDARILVEYLQLPSSDSDKVFYWEDWNEKHPELAKVFWPRIAELARHEMYLAIPDIMRLAMSVPTGEEITDQVESFDEQLTKMTAAAFQLLGELDKSNGRTDRGNLRLQHATTLQVQ